MKNKTGFVVGGLYVVSIPFPSSRGLSLEGRENTAYVYLQDGDIVIFLGKAVVSQDFDTSKYRFFSRKGILSKTMRFGELDPWFEKL